MGDDRETRAGGQVFRFGQAVSDLPIEVVLRYKQKRFSLAIGIGDIELSVFAAQVHVRGEAGNVHILLEGVAFGNFHIGVARGEAKHVIA